MRVKALAKGVQTKANGTEFGLVSSIKSRVTKGATVPIASKKYKNRRKTTMSDLKIFTENIEPEALNQIYTHIKQPAFADYKASE